MGGESAQAERAANKVATALDARGATQDEDGERWEEKLLYEGEQIEAALHRLAELSPDDAAADALAAMRSAQDVIAW